MLQKKSQPKKSERTYVMLKAPRRGFVGLVSVSTPGKEVTKQSRYSLAILLNFCQRERWLLVYYQVLTTIVVIVLHISISQEIARKWILVILYLSGSAVLDGDLDEGLARLLVLAAARLALLCGWLRAAASFSSHLRRNIRRALRCFPLLYETCPSSPPFFPLPLFRVPVISGSAKALRSVGRYLFNRELFRI